MNLRAKITKAFHRVEKGLSLKDSRPGFGKPVVRVLINDLRTYVDRYGVDHAAGAAINTLRAYCEFNQENRAGDQWIQNEVNGLLKRMEQANLKELRGGVVELTRCRIQESSMVDLTDFFASRYSIRTFSPESVARDAIAQAIAMAQKTPSVCNRQAWRVYCYHDDETKRSVLAHQNGNRGFGHLANWVLAVTCDLRHFLSIGERNQAWIDGGMFAMSLLYALHSLGLGACPLNCSLEKEEDIALRHAGRIDEHDAIIMLIAVGHLPDRLRVAQSPRKSLDEVMIEMDSDVLSNDIAGNAKLVADDALSKPLCTASATQ